MWWEDHDFCFQAECIWKFCSKNVAFLTSRFLHLRWSVSFQVWSTPRWVMSALRETICRTFVQHLPVLPKKHNRAKQMSELSPALISIAGGNEFLFARFYHVYEGVQLVLPESPPIVSGVSDMPRRIVQTWKRHGIRCKICLEEIHTFFSTEWFRLIFIPEPVSAFTSI